MSPCTPPSFKENQVERGGALLVTGGEGPRA